MSYTLEYKEEVVNEDIPLLNTKIRNIILRKLEILRENPYLGVPLKGDLFGYFKLKVSSYRIVYKIHKAEHIIIIVSIGKREKLKAYKTALKRIK